MKTVLSIILSLAMSTASFSQTYSLQEAEAVALRLRDENFLNEKGANALLLAVRKAVADCKPWRSADIYSLHMTPETRAQLVQQLDMEVNKLSAGTILEFLAQAFSKEFHYRNGTYERMRIMQEYEKRKPKDADTSMEQLVAYHKAIQERFQELWPTFPGPKIEEAIPIEDSLDQRGHTIYGPLDAGGGEPGYIHPSRSAVGKTRTRLVRDLERIGLISPSTAAELLPLIQNNSLRLESDVVAHAARRAAYFRDYERNKCFEIELARGLVRAGVMTDAGFTLLLSSYEHYELKDKRGLLPFCERTIIIETADMPVAPQAFYEAVFARIQDTLLPNFRYTALKAVIEQETREISRTPDGSEPPIFRRNMVLSFRADGKTYRTKFLHDFVGGRNLSGSKHPVSHEFAKGINKWLANRESPYRLYYAIHPDTTEAGGVYGEEKFGLLLMTEAGFNAWHTGGGDYFISEEKHYAAFNAKGLAHTVSFYDSLGMFAHLSAEEKIAGQRLLEERAVTSYVEILRYFPKTVVVWDWETGNLENPYEELTRELAAASRGAFAPTDIQDHFGKDLDTKPTTRFGFTFRGKRYERELEMRGDWLDPAFLELLQQALRNAGVDGDWRYCLDNGQESGFIFLTDAQYATLKEKQPALLQER